MWNDVTYNTTDVTPGTTANITCPSEFIFPDRSVSIVTYCDLRGDWNPPIENCIREFEYQFKIINIITFTDPAKS